MSNKLKLFYYSLIFISSILLLFSASTFKFPTPMGSLSAKAQNEGKVASQNNTAGIPGSKGKFTLVLKFYEFVTNTYKPLFQVGLPLEIAIMNSNGEELVYVNLKNGNVYRIELPFGIYKIKVFYTALISDYNEENGPIIAIGKFTYVKLSTMLENFVLDRDKTLIFYFKHALITPSVLNAYDLDGNSILEYENNEFITVQTSLATIQDIINEKYQPKWAFLYLNDTAIGYTSTGGLFIFPDYALFIFTNYPTTKKEINLKGISSTEVYSIFMKVEEE